jgi:hypothetical protein
LGSIGGAVSANEGVGVLCGDGAALVLPNDLLPALCGEESGDSGASSSFWYFPDDVDGFAEALRPLVNMNAFFNVNEVEAVCVDEDAGDAVAVLVLLDAGEEDEAARPCDGADACRDSF